MGVFRRRSRRQSSISCHTDRRYAMRLFRGLGEVLDASRLGGRQPTDKVHLVDRGSASITPTVHGPQTTPEPATSHARRGDGGIQRVCRRCPTSAGKVLTPLFLLFGCNSRIDQQKPARARRKHLAMIPKSVNRAATRQRSAAARLNRAHIG
jgi:hypothetical protein